MDVNDIIVPYCFIHRTILSILLAYLKENLPLKHKFKF